MNCHVHENVWQHHPFTPWASYQIRKIAGCACAGNAGNVSPCRRFQRKPLVSDPGMHHGTCVTHVPWCMSRSLTCGDRENVPGIPGACAPAILRIWQEAHWTECIFDSIVITQCIVPSLFWHSQCIIECRIRMMTTNVISHGSLETVLHFMLGISANKQSR